MSFEFNIEDNVARGLTFRHIFSKIWPFLKKYPRLLWQIAIIVTLYTLVGRSLPIVFGYGVDHAIQEKNWPLVYWVAGLFSILELGRAGFSYLQSTRIQALGHQVLYDIRHRLLEHVQNLPISFFDKTSSGRVVTRVTNDIQSLGELFSQGFTTLFIGIIEIITILMTLFFISPLLTLCIALLLPPLIWSCAFLSQTIRIKFGAAKRRLALINGFTAESIQGMKVLQLFNQQPSSQTHFNQLSHEYKNLQLSTVRLFATLWPIIEAFNVGTVAITLLIGGYFQSELSFTAGGLASYLLLVQSFFRPLRAILERYNQLQNSLASADRVFQMFCLKTETETLETSQNQGEIQLRGSIHFNNVSFTYPDKEKPALQNIHLKICSGESIALVGRTGSGKSTLVALLQRFYEIQDGQILIDGNDMKTYPLHALRSRIGVVQQDPFILKGSILDNITLRDSKITMERAIKAAQEAQCDHLIFANKHGDLRQIEERGANLSLGERQLISFARVLAFDPDIVILDEATANIDSISEKNIQEVTERVLKYRTSLIIAHRLSTIQKCDRIVVIDQGRIIEEGLYQDLLNRKGALFTLHQAQNKSTTLTPNSDRLELGETQTMLPTY